MGVINIGGDGVITIDGRKYEVISRNGMYIGMGAKDIVFESKDASDPAKFYINSAPAHKAASLCAGVPTATAYVKCCR